ncbi:UNVERIFIED_CONTAM: hypothetical protein PYX00_004632 [Menopon gallinae]|uniref:Uncharacterized protein n=1 Tax=Menopon gallinae TaxID=328185 RepID=A0AAW2I6H8_9NEOP
MINFFSSIFYSNRGNLKFPSEKDQKMSVSNSNNELRRIIRFEEDGDRKKEFEPVTYTFRVPEKGKKGGSSVLSPPEWLLLDHTIAVVWSLFNSSLSANLDIDDLKWAHEFLKEVRNNKGENPPDVKTCLTEIQNRLISLYAQLTHKEDKSKEQESATVSKTETVIVEPSNSVKEPKQEKDSTKRTNNPSRKQVVPPKEHRKSSQPPFEKGERDIVEAYIREETRSFS